VHFFKVVLFTLLLFSFSQAKEPKLELGIGAGTLYYPNYIGSKTMKTIIAPLPYLRYRGDYIKIDEDGLTGNLFGIHGLRIDLSMSASLPADSKKDDAREGMPDLDLTGEVGFQLVYKFFEDGPYVLEFELPFRAVISTDFSSLKYRGILSNPQLKYSMNYSEFEWTLRFGLLFGDEEYNNYYYGVTEEYVTVDRDYYKADAGFGGFRSRIGMTYKKGNWWIGSFISYYNISDAVFEKSPLIETNTNIYTGASLAYIFYTAN